MEFPYRVRGQAAVDAVLASLAKDDTFTSACFVASSAHGFSMEIEYLRRPDGSARYRTWSDVQGIISSEERPVALDFAEELERLRAAGPVDVARSGSPQARLALVVLATRATGSWLEVPVPGRGDARGDGALDRIFQLVAL